MELNKKEINKIIKTSLKEGILKKCPKCKRIYLWRFDNPNCPHNNMSKKERNKIVLDKIKELKDMGVLE